MRFWDASVLFRNSSTWSLGAGILRSADSALNDTKKDSTLNDKELLARVCRFVMDFLCVIESRCGEESRSLLDRRLAEAARREGFPVLGVR